jgi:glycine cleavage system transcriptional repressor
MKNAQECAGEWIAISVIGRDRPGIIAGVSKVLYQNRYNIEELSQTATRGQFAMILLASPREEKKDDRLSEDLRLLMGDLNLDINLRRVTAEERVPYATGKTEPFIITVKGEDRPGLVYGIAEVLAERGINITNLDAQVAVLDGKVEYIQIFEVDIPLGLDYGLIQEKLRERGKEMGVAVDLQHRGIFRAMNQI